MVNVLLQGVVGSVAYGLDTPDSDVDRLGVFAANTLDVVSLSPPAETQVRTEPDITLHEVRKYCKLALGCNPTVMELMWLNEYETTHPLGLDLVRIRDAFLSRDRVRNAYLGYASQQFKRLSERGGSFSSDTGKRTEKHARHLARLCMQGYHLYRTGQLVIKLNPIEVGAIRGFGRRVAEGDIDVARERIAGYEKLFDEVRSPLPLRPDVNAVGWWLRNVRLKFLFE